MDEKFNKELFKSNGLLWRTAFDFYGVTYIHSPICPRENCHTTLEKKSETDMWCPKCEVPYSLKKPYETLRGEIQRAYEGFKTLDYPIYSLELPLTKIGARDEDENYWIEAKLGQKDGKRTAVVYIGSKKDKDKVQGFIDIDDEQIRFDKTNKKPTEVATKIEVTFANSKVTVQGNEKKL